MALVRCPGCAGNREVSESLFGPKVPCAKCRGLGEISDGVEARPSASLEESRAVLLAARQSGIRDCKRACLQAGIAARLERTAAKSEAVSRECDARIRESFSLYKRLSDVEAWAWNSESLAVACVHEKAEALDDERMACLDCGTLFKRG